MSEIDRVLRRAWWRILAVRLVYTFVVALAIAVAVLVLAHGTQKLIPFTADWLLAWAAAGLAALGGSIIWVVMTSPSPGAVARAVDDRAELREALSTALCLRDSNDPWSRAAVGHATAVAQRVIVRQAFPWRSPRMWPIPIIGIILFFVIGLLPATNILADDKSAAAGIDQRDVLAAQQDVAAIEDKLDKVLAKVDDDELEELFNEELDPEAEDAERSPEEIRRGAMRRLTSVQDRLDEMRNGDRARTFEELKSRLEQLRSPKGADAELGDMLKKLQQGDFEGAKEALADLMNKVNSGDMSDEARAKLAEQMQQLAEQLEQLSQKQSELAEALKKAGIDPALASDAEALAEALANSSLSEAQKQQLMKQAQACQSACKMCESMSGACMSAAQMMAEGESGLGELSELGEQLTAAEMIQQELQSIEAAMSECQSQMAALGQCMGSQGANSRFGQNAGQGQGSGNRGQGGGKQPDAEQADFAVKTERSKSPQQASPIVGSMTIEGAQLRGEARRQFREAVRSAGDGYTEAIEQHQIPREYEDSIKRYFERLHKTATDEETDADGEG